VEGFDNRIKNLRFNNFQLFMQPEDAIDKRSRNGFLFNNVDNLRMLDCSVNWNQEKTEKEWESAYSFENVVGVQLIRTEGKQAPNKNYPAFRFSNVTDLKIDGEVMNTSQPNFNF
ncbi:MAG: hypothetical protein ACRC8J_04925, partial [Phocaeicola sp.]